MSEKYLPIKIFEKRKDYDDRSTEGGGDSHEGSWVLHGEELNKRVDYLSKNVNTIQDSFQKWKENKRALPMIISTTVIDKAIAKTHRGRIVNLLENDGKQDELYTREKVNEFIQHEIDEVTAIINKAESIKRNAKMTALKQAVEKAFVFQNEAGIKQRIVVFTESIRTQTKKIKSAAIPVNHLFGGEEYVKVKKNDWNKIMDAFSRAVSRNYLLEKYEKNSSIVSSHHL